MVPRMAMLRKVLLPAAAIVVSCSVVFLHSPRAAAAADDEIRAQYSSLRSSVSSVSGADQNLHHHHALSIEGPEEGKGYRRGLMTFGVPSEGLLLAVANSDEDEIDGLGHEDAATEDFTHWHKRLLPLNARDYATFALGAVGLMLAAAGGIGGGGILVPVFIFVNGFGSKYAVPLSNVTIFGGAITNTFLNMRKRHPRADRPMVDWDLILVMEPVTMIGALVGSFVQKVLPEIFLTLSMILLLWVTADRMLRKGFRTFKKETSVKEAEISGGTQDLQVSAAAEQDSADHALLGNGIKSSTSYGAAAGGDDGGKGTFSPVVPAPSSGAAAAAAAAVTAGVETLEEAAMITPTTTSTSPVLKAGRADALQKLLEEERHTSFAKVGIMTAVFAVSLAINLLKGGGAFKSPVGIECGSFAFWATSILSGVYLMAVCWQVGSYLVKRWRLKAELGYQYVEGDVEWTPLNTVRYPCICFFAGFFAGMFGVGGGIVKGPLMLEMGVHPMVASSTSAVMILYTSFTATTSFVVFGLLQADYAVALFFLGLSATAVGQYGTDYIIEKFKRPSFIILSIGSVVALSAVLMGIDGVHGLLYPEGGAEGGICSDGE